MEEAKGDATIDTAADKHGNLETLIWHRTRKMIGVEVSIGGRRRDSGRSRGGGGERKRPPGHEGSEIEELRTGKLVRREGEEAIEGSRVL